MDRFILGRIGKAMRDQFDDVTNEPLPEHLIELIKLLIEQRQGEPPLNSLDAFIKNAAQRLLELQKDLKDIQRQIDQTRWLVGRALELRSDPPICL